MRPRLVMLGLTLAAATALAVLRANGSEAHASSWPWRGAITTHGPQQLVRTPQVALLASGDGAGLRLFVRAGGRFTQQVGAEEADDAPIAAFVVANNETTETVVGVVRSDVGRVILRSENGTERSLPLNDVGAFASPSLSAGTSWQLGALAADGSSISHVSLPQAAAPCGGAIGPCRATAIDGRNAWSLSTARAAARRRATALPRAFRRPARPSDRLPERLSHIIEAGASGASPDRVVASRRVASYTDGRGRRAVFYLIESLRRICTLTTWGSGAGGGCNPISNPFGGRHMIGGSGHLFSAIVDDSVAKVVVVGRLGVRHPVAINSDRAFIYDCKAYSGCTCVVSRIDAYNKGGKIIQSQQLPTGCRKPSSAAPIGQPDYTKKNGTIAWLFHHQPRGISLRAAGIRLTDTVGSHWQPVRFARVLRPDPTSRYRVVLSLIGKRGRNICMTEFTSSSAHGGGCAIGLDLKPFNFNTVFDESGEAVISGVASDDVARMAFALSDGRTTSIPLKDNVFVAALSKGSAARPVVAYDRQGRVMRMTRIPSPIRPLR
jgi:hypothetical protein